MAEEKYGAHVGGNPFWDDQEDLTARILWELVTEEKRKSILLKAEKLLALTDSPNDNEAASAKRFLGRLLAKYSLSMADIRTTKKAAEAVGKMDIVGRGTHRCAWEGQLASAVAGVFDGNVITSGIYEWTPSDSYSERRRSGWKIHFIAAHNDLPMIEHFFLYLRRYIGQGARVKYRKVADRNKYAMGMVFAVKERLKEIAGYRLRAMSDSRELVPVLKHLIARETKRHFPHVRKTKSNARRGSIDAYRRGVVDGKKVPLNRPLGEGAEKPGYLR